MDTTVTYINNLSPVQFIEYIQTEDIDKLHSLKLYLDDKYYNTGESVIHDERYDELKDILVQRDPDYTPPIGAQLREGENRVKLPYYMGSMDKFKEKDNQEIIKWQNKHKSKDYVITEKLDGVSCLLDYKDSVLKLYTRGDGVIGADISYLAKYIQHIPRIDDDITVRGELIIPKNIFQEKYQNDYANARNMVSGIVNSKTIRPGIRDVEFIAYEIVKDTQSPNLSSQLTMLETLGFKTVKTTNIKQLNSDILKQTLQTFREKSEFEIDGIIIQANKPYIRNTSDNPDYAFAFKMITDVANVEVVDVLWDITRWGLLKPRIEIKPTHLSGITITYATGFNAKYIIDNDIGPGAIVQITRSGDVIPYILDVIKKASEPSLPDIPYKWNETNVDIIAITTGKTMCIKIIVHFFTTLNIKQISEATVEKMLNAGFSTLMDILNASKDDFLKIENFKEKSAARTYNNIHNGLQAILMSDLMVASSIFGFGLGKKRSKILLDTIPDLITNYKNKTIEDIIAVEGFSSKSAKKIIDGLYTFSIFLEKISRFVSFKTIVNITNDLQNMKYVFTGFRDAALEDKIIARGGSITSSVSKNTTAVVAKDISNISGKLKKAMDLNVPIYTIDDFITRYNL